MQRVVILGAGGLAREVADVFNACNTVKREYEVIGFIDEDPAKYGKELNGYPVLGGWNWFDDADKSEIRVITGIGNPVSRYKTVKKALKAGLQFCTVIHPNAIATQFITYGVGSVITAGCILTNQIVVGNYSYLNLDCTVGHDVQIKDYCNINPGVHISGNVCIEDGCEIGTGATINQNLTIGKWTTVGAGSVVVKDLPSNVTAVGIPAKVIKEREPFLD